MINRLKCLGKLFNTNKYCCQNVILFSLIPPDSVVPPLKPADISGTDDGHHAHAEHAMNPIAGNFNKNYFFLCFSK